MAHYKTATHLKQLFDWSTVILWLADQTNQNASFLTASIKYVHFIILPRTGYKLWTSGILTDWSANWATTLCPWVIFND